jgi:hypothetical protein
MSEVRDTIHIRVEYFTDLKGRRRYGLSVLCRILREIVAVTIEPGVN